MSIPNRITLEQLKDLPPSKIAVLAVDELALLAEELADLKGHVTASEAKFRSGLDVKYGQRAAEARTAAGKDTGVVRVTDGAFVVVAELPKKVTWDQAKLTTAVKTIVEKWRDDPAQYVTTEYKISETAYGAWPDVLRKLFELARTVETGKPTYRIEPRQQEGV